MSATRDRLGALAALAALAGGSVVLTGAALGIGGTYVTGGREAPDWLLGPLRFTSNGLGKDGVFLAVTAMLLGYLGLLATREALPRRIVIGALVILHAWFVLGPLLFSGDVVFYLGLGRVWALDHLDPYAVGRIAGRRANEVSVYAGIWEALPSTYGPAFLGLSGALAFLGITGSVWAFKLISGTAALLVLRLVWVAARRLGRDPLWAVVFVGANPVWLAWLVGGAHNDSVVMAGFMASVVLVLSGSERLGGLALAATFAIKLSVAPLAPFLLLAARRRSSLLLGSAIGVVVLLVAGFALFPPSWLHHWLLQSQDQARISGPGPLKYAMGLVGIDTDPVPLSIRVLAEYAGFLVFAALLVWSWWTGDWLTGAGWTAFVVLVASAWLREWYLAWLLPLAALAPSRRLSAAAVALTVFVALTSDRWILDVFS